MDETSELGRQVNRLRWDELTPLHAASEFYDLAGFRQGRDDIRPFEADELGDVSGKDLLHLQCHLGTDTLSWARRGARVVGLEFSARSIEVATQLAKACNLDAEFVCADVYDAQDALKGRQFDIVYTGMGALGWLPNLDQWATVVSELLRPGGVLYLVEIHPMVHAVQGDGRTLSQDVFEDEYRRWDVQGTYAAPTAELTNSESYERNHALSDVLGGVLDAGLTIELFHEQSCTRSQFPPWLVRGSDGFFRLPEGWPKYPLTYSLRARR